MKKNKLKSFTLSELLVVMIITAIVVGMAFSVLRLVQKQIHIIEVNFEKSTNLVLFEQKLWQDFNELNEVAYNENDRSLYMKTDMDSVLYSFQDNYILRNTDTLKLKLKINKLFFEGNEVKNGNVDALFISGDTELPEYEIFVSKKNDLTLSMNQEDGL